MIKNKDGMTLVEVMVAFVILLMGIAFIYQATMLSLNQINKAKEIQDQVDTAISSYYEADQSASSMSDENAIQLTIHGNEGDGVTFSLPMKSGQFKSEDDYYIYFFDTKEEEGE